MARYRRIYWCIDHQQFVASEAKNKSRKLRNCKIVRLNLTILRQIDLDKLSAWIMSQHSSKYRVDKPRQSLRLARKMGWIGA